MILAWIKAAQYWIVGIVVATLFSALFLQTLRLSNLQKGIAERNAAQERQARELSEQYRKQEADTLIQSQANYENYLATKKDTDIANATLAATANGLRDQLATYKRAVSSTSANPAGSIATGTIGIDVFFECTERYSALAQETGRIADSKNALIDQVN